MKVLQVNKYPWSHVGGIERVVGDIAKAFTTSEVEVRLLCIADSTNPVKIPSVVFVQRNFQLFGMPVSWDFFRAAKQEFAQADVILLHHPFPLGFLVYWLYGWSKPVLVWYHSDIVRQSFLAWLLKPLFRKILERADRIIISHLSIAKNSNLLKGYEYKMVEIPFAHSVPSDTTPISNKVRLHLLAVGRLVYYKGYEYLLRAMVGLDAELVIIGAGPLLASLEQLIWSLGLQNVKIIPPVSEQQLADYYRNCDVFILPSVEKSEAFGLVQIEAMSYGKPVINTWLPTAVPYVSVDGITGITVAPKNVEALRTAIKAFISDPQLKLRYGQAAQKRVVEVYNFEQFKNKLTTVINETLAK